MSNLVKLSLEAHGQSATKALKRLWLHAMEQEYLACSRIFHMKGEDCLPTTSNSDGLNHIRMIAQRLAVANGRVLQVPPEEILSFYTQLPNRRLAVYGLARYPSHIQVAQGQQFVTPWDVDSWFWTTQVDTMDDVTTDRQTAVRSHEMVIKLLKHAQELQMLQVIEDPTGFWKDNNEALLTNRCEKELKAHEESRETASPRRSSTE